MKYYLIAGEASGDLHGANLMRAIQKKDAQAKFRFWGGDHMLSVDNNIVQHYKNTSFMGFIEVAKNIFKILTLLKKCKQDILTFDPDVLILIDYPGFNLRISQWAKKNHIKTAYYIAPQAWAWKESRVTKMKQTIDRLFVILPFEEKFFRDRGMEAYYYGHPLSEALDMHKTDSSEGIEIPAGCIACLPGSRAQEIRRHLPYIKNLASNHPANTFIVAGVTSVDPNLYEAYLEENMRIVYDRTYEVLSKAQMGIIASGTATLEACMFRLPQMVIYKGNPLSYQIAKMLIKVKYISLVNLIADEKIIPELIQNDVNNENLSKQFKALLHPERKQDQLTKYELVLNQLHQNKPSQFIARDIINLAND